jgi:hypothetical protein
VMLPGLKSHAPKGPRAHPGTPRRLRLVHGSRCRRCHRNVSARAASSSRKRSFADVASRPRAVFAERSDSFPEAAIPCVVPDRQHGFDSHHLPNPPPASGPLPECTHRSWTRVIRPILAPATVLHIT